MAETYSDFAEVYDEFMDDTPYEEWCHTIVGLIEQYGISRPVRRPDSTSQVIGDSVCSAPDSAGGNVSDSDMTGTAASNNMVMAAEEKAAVLASERDLVLDLGCGTGTLTELLYRKGYDMVGVDNAPTMLDIAIKKREKSGAQILYLLQDMRELELYSTIGTVISVCDSVNYILEESELLQVFRLVNNYLFPGGIFLFDFNTEYKYREVIGDSTIAETREDCSFIWENYYDAESCLNEYDVTVFVRQSFWGHDPGCEGFGEKIPGQEDLFRRFTETHVQRGYTVTQMEKLVREAGMRIVKIMDAESLGEVTEESERVYILARECTKEIERIR